MVLGGSVARWSARPRRLHWVWPSGLECVAALMLVCAERRRPGSRRPVVCVGWGVAGCFLPSLHRLDRDLGAHGRCLAHRETDLQDSLVEAGGDVVGVYLG